jgi:hypothetical protein
MSHEDDAGHVTLASALLLTALLPGAKTPEEINQASIRAIILATALYGGVVLKLRADFPPPPSSAPSAPVEPEDAPAASTDETPNPKDLN